MFNENTAASDQRPTANLSFNWFTLAMDHCVWSNNAVWWWICLNHFEFHCSHASSHQEYVAFVQRPIGLEKVRLEVDIEQIAAITWSYKYRPTT